MKFNIQSHVLSKELKKHEKLTNNKLLPILTCIRLEFKGNYNELHFESSDLSKALKTKLHVMGNGTDFIVCVSCDELLQIANKHQSDLAIEVLNNQLQVRSLTHTYTLDLFPVNEFPVFPKPSMDLIKLPAFFLKTMFNEVAFASAKLTDKIVTKDKTVTKLQLTCINFSCNKKESYLSLAATNGYKLAESRCPIENPVDITFNLLKTDFEAFVNLLVIEYLELSKNSSWFFFTNVDKSYSFAIRQVDATFPVYKKIIPDIENTDLVTYRVNSKEFRSKLGKISIPPTNKLPVVKLLNSFPPINKLAIVYQDAGVFSTSGNVSLDISYQEGYSNANIPLFFTIPFLKEVLKAIKTEYFYMFVQGKDKPVLIKTSLGDPYSIVICPLLNYKEIT